MIWLVIEKTLKYPKADAAKRTIFQKKINEHETKDRSIVYIDENGFSNDIPRTHGYSKIGDRCYGTQDRNAKGCQNVIAGLPEDSLIGCGIIDSNIDTTVFNTWVENLSKNSAVLMDNAAFHKSQRTRN